MTITWYGEGCFKIQSGDLTILTDPFSNSTGLTPPRLKADIVMKTITPFPPQEEENGGTHFIYGAGEYNLKGINVLGLSLPQESTDKYLKTAYLAEIENLNLLFLGHISAQVEPGPLERIEEADILFLPGGGKPFIDQKSAVKIVKALEPRIVIPSFFKIAGLKRQSSDVKNFLEEFGFKHVKEQDRLTVKRRDVSEIKSTEIIVLQA